MPTISQAMELALKYHHAGALRQAESIYRQVLQTDPGNADAIHLLGVIAYQEDKFDVAISLIQQAIQLRPPSAAFHSDFGLALQAAGRLDEAVASQRAAIRLQPDYATAYSNLGSALVDLARLDEAVGCYETARQLGMQSPVLHYNLGQALHLLGRFDEALANYEEAIVKQPNYGKAHWNRAQAWLLLGDYERGWAEYEWRTHLKEFPQMPLPANSRWDGSELHGRTILLHQEGGLGDTIQFVRFAPFVTQRGGRVIVACDPPLLDLISTCAGVAAAVSWGGPLPPHDVHFSMQSLPGFFQTTLETIPAAVPYLQADRERTEHWRQKLAGETGLKVGIAWQGNPQYRRDRERSIPLRHFALLTQINGVRLFSLQKGKGTEELPGFAAEYPITDLAGELNTFMDTAAVMMNLDLIITVDTAIAHCAGALGKPFWILLWSEPEWRWLLEREDSPWYPTARLFRQNQRGDWPEVMGRVVGELERLILHRYS